MEWKSDGAWTTAGTGDTIVVLWKTQARTFKISKIKLKSLKLFSKFYMRGKVQTRNSQIQKYFTTGA